MVSGHPGQPGPTVAQYVVEEHQQGQEHAVVKHVEEVLVLETTMS